MRLSGMHPERAHRAWMCMRVPSHQSRPPSTATPLPAGATPGRRRRSRPPPAPCTSISRTWPLPAWAALPTCEAVDDRPGPVLPTREPVTHVKEERGRPAGRRSFLLCTAGPAAPCDATLLAVLFTDVLTALMCDPSRLPGRGSEEQAEMEGADRERDAAARLRGRWVAFLFSRRRIATSRLLERW